MFPFCLRAFLCSFDCSCFVLLSINGLKSSYEYEYDRRQDIEQGNTSQNAVPRNSISGMSSLLFIVCLYMEILIEIGVEVF